MLSLADISIIIPQERRECKYKMRKNKNFFESKAIGF
ncbi:hypothetical protein BACCAP_01912 [Pseudoflavonifractor capillosus ATCC 29799]|uniref:Uncharacterized protein n=1 Tax=Pseudoflavonifractor capillosus ATCC 29799 TaxID=411467 RepID=A6NUM9_9FIRM|nr:hypothetical protein BACCAP_01912 [Pseudoflavonifractor capillosus ATCC 29799]